MNDDFEGDRWVELAFGFWCFATIIAIVLVATSHGAKGEEPPTPYLLTAAITQEQPEEFHLLDDGLIVFTATWCGPCQATKQPGGVFHDLDKINAPVQFVDIDEHPDLAELYGIKSIPKAVFRGCPKGIWRFNITPGMSPDTVNRLWAAYCKGEKPPSQKQVSPACNCVNCQCENCRCGYRVQPPSRRVYSAPRQYPQYRYSTPSYPAFSPGSCPGGNCPVQQWR